jgi:tetratricopeptide (TPR) repeat protein
VYLCALAGDDEMTWQPNSPERQALIRLAMAPFKSQGWTITKGGYSDFHVEKWHLRFHVICYDASIRQYKDGAVLLDQMASNSRSFGGNLVSVLNFDFLGITFEKLADMDFVAIKVDELVMATTLADFQDQVPGSLNKRQRMLLQRSPWACIIIAQQFRAKNDKASAIEWAQRAVAGSGDFSAAYACLFETYFSTDDLEGANKAALDALERYPTNPELLRALHRIAVARGSDSEAVKWNKRLQQAEEIKPADFDSILKRQSQRTSATLSDPTKTHRELENPPAAKDRGFAYKLKRMFTAMGGARSNR